MFLYKYSIRKVSKERGDGMKDDPIAQVLDDLMRLDDILACMVARRNMISVMPLAEGFKPEVNQIWDVIKRAMDEVFIVISQYSSAGLGEMEFRLQDNEVLFYVFPDTENALVAIVPALANKGLLEVEMENARREILKIMGLSEKERLVATA
jgi:predicted regulator of Ras-like GTPase activity (Roadblock/LC7/MglB family)